MFLKRLNEITRPRVHSVQADLGLGDGVETLYFRELTFEERQRIFVARADADGKLDIRDKGLFLGAELVSASLCHEDGSQVATVEAVRKWDSKLVEKIGNEAMKAIAIKEETPAENPLKGQS